jgi:hypothetical protein
MRIGTVLLILALVIGANSLQAQNTEFITVKLDYGVYVDVPINWWVISGTLNSTLESYARTLVDLTGMSSGATDKVNLFRANSMPKSTYASIAVNLSPSDVTPAQVIKATQEELQAIATSLSEELRKGIDVKGGGPTLGKISLDGNPTVQIRYKREGLNGPVVVEMNKIVLPNRVVSLNLAYRESEERIWKLVVQRIRTSFRIRK